jgi:hypothetical protein
MKLRWYVANRGLFLLPPERVLRWVHTAYGCDISGMSPVARLLPSGARYLRAFLCDVCKIAIIEHGRKYSASECKTLSSQALNSGIGDSTSKTS